MRLRTIWTIPAMSTRERLDRTADWAAQQVAWHLPPRIAYWSFIRLGVRAIGNEVVPEVTYVDVLKRVPGGPP